jgi:hypothetical protein
MYLIEVRETCDVGQRVRVVTEFFERRRPWLLVLQDSIAHTLKVIVRMPDSWVLGLARSGLAELDVVEFGRWDGSVECRDVCDYVDIGLGLPARAE